MRALFLLLLVAYAAGAARDPADDFDLLPGWQAESYRPSVEPGPVRGQMKVLDADARIFLWENFLSAEECEHIIALAEPHLERSGVVSNENGGSEINDVRTSNGMFLRRGQDNVVSAIENRIARWTLMPEGHGEGLQVLRYKHNQEYREHWDYFFNKEGTENGGNRYATVLTYLADTEEGGETVFPNIPAPGGENVGFSECARYHLAAKPRRGDAVLFHSIKPNGELERRSLHSACPVIKGVKWSMPKWIHVGHYANGSETAERIEQHPQKIPGPPGCEDKDAACENWAAAGECDKNPVFMVGSRALPGRCLLACERCDVVKPALSRKMGRDA